MDVATSGYGSQRYVRCAHTGLSMRRRDFPGRGTQRWKLLKRLLALLVHIHARDPRTVQTLGLANAARDDA